MFLCVCGQIECLWNTTLPGWFKVSHRWWGVSLTAAATPGNKNTKKKRTEDPLSVCPNPLVPFSLSAGAKSLHAMRNLHSPQESCVLSFLYTCHCSVCSNACLPATLSNQDRELCKEAVLFFTEKFAKSWEVGYNDALMIYMCVQVKFDMFWSPPQNENSVLHRHADAKSVEGSQSQQTEVDGDLF